MNDYFRTNCYANYSVNKLFCKQIDIYTIKIYICTEKEMY